MKIGIIILWVFLYGYSMNKLGVQKDGFYIIYSIVIIFGGILLIERLFKGKRST
ncbi:MULTISPECIES: hypothetical protein [unclassified Lysinibacillus]|uniref:hypothetical protein n=1 Tax=unclassified Lysinibacillus TaxID=2636778 RepID=UPI00131F1B12|nr:MULTISPECIES: hypothetical protein [unclassified Lysinibacillus]